jgi:hypothetical protein
LAADGNDMFKLDLTNAERCIVSGGQVIDLSNNDIDYHTKKIQFENTAVTDYEVHIKYASVPEELALDPRKGIPKYSAFMDTFGEYGLPDSVTDTPGVQIKLIVDTLTEATVSNAGRKCRALMLTPLSASSTVAFYEATIQWDTVNNYILIPYAGGNGPLGQDTSSDPPSTLAADYRVWVYGPTVRRFASLKADDTYAYIGDVQGAAAGPGNPPTVFDVTTQPLIFLITLDLAYDGIGAGGGRVIVVDSGGVEYQMYNGTALRPDINRAHILKDIANQEVGRLEPFGRYADVRRFKDDFHYTSTQWDITGGPVLTPTFLYSTAPVGAGSKITVMATPMPANYAASGVIEISAAAGGVDNNCQLSGPNSFNLSGQRPGVYFRFAAATGGVANDQLILRMRNGRVGAALPDLAFGVLLTGVNLQGAVWDASGLPNPIFDPALLSANLIAGIGAGMVDVYCLVTGPTTIEFWATGMTTPISLSIAATALNFDTVAYAEMAFWMLEAVTVTRDGVSQENCYLDCWECWTRGLLLAP